TRSLCLVSKLLGLGSGLFVLILCVRKVLRGFLLLFFVNSLYLLVMLRVHCFWFLCATVYARMHVFVELSMRVQTFFAKLVCKSLMIFRRKSSCSLFRKLLLRLRTFLVATTSCNLC